MTHTPDQDPPRETPRPQPRRRQIFWWYAGWLAALGLGARLLLAQSIGLVDLTIGALSAAAVPAVYGVLSMDADRPFDHALAAVIWAVGGATACLLAGGVSGPLAVWCLLPIVATTLNAGASVLAFSAAMSLAALGVAALATPLLGLPPAPPSVTYGLGLLAMATTAVGLAGGLVITQSAVGAGRRRAERVESQLRTLLDEQPCLLALLESGRRVSAVYGHAPQGVVAGEMVDRALALIVDPPTRPVMEDALRRALSDGAAEVGFAPAGAPETWAVATIRRVGQQRLIAVIRDATAERAREVELVRGRDEADAQNAGKSRFLANMSHELRTPLNAIMGFSDIMRARLLGPLPDKYGEYAELIHESGSHLLELINDVLDMSKIEAERYELIREAFDAREAVNAVLRLMRGQADRAGVNLRGVLPRIPLEVDADRRALKQIALNLISNALKFTPKGGAVTVTLQEADGALELAVADTGVGIGPQDLTRIGRPYEQAGDAERRMAGTGLGLSLVRAFAELHGGEMTMESALGEGTTVTVRLPVLATDAPALNPEPTA